MTAMKLKTKQAASKRFHFSGTGKVQRRHVRQAHFNSRATGNETRGKRGRLKVDSTDFGRIEELLPYNL